MKKVIILIILIILIKSVVQTNAHASTSLSDQHTIDSLRQVIKTARHDTTRINAYFKWDEVIYLQNPDSSIILNLKACEIANKLLATHPPANVADTAKKQLADALNNIGYIYNNQGDIPKALEYYNKSLNIQEEIGDKKGMAYSFNNIGYIYNNKGETHPNPSQREELLNKALEYYNKSLNIREEIGDKKGMAMSFNNIGYIYNQQGETHPNPSLWEGLLKKALEYFNKSLNIQEEIGDKKGMAISLYNIGKIYLANNNILNAKNKFEQSYKLSKELGFPDDIESAASGLKKVYLKQGNYKLAYEFYTEEVLMHDSIQNEENYKKTQKQQAKYEYEKQAATDSITHTKAMEIKDLDLKRQKAEGQKQRVIIMFVVCGLLLVVVFSVFLFRLFMQKKKANLILARQKQQIEIQNSNLNQANEEITTQRDEITAQRDEITAQRDLVTQQKEHIEEIHKEVTDSINYAKRIQEAMLPALSTNLQGFQNLGGLSDLALAPATLPKFETLAKFNPETFILFRPKDVVSGDFYWFSKVNDYQIYAVADCTGHGVPGAFMSMLGISFLNEIVRKKEVTQASHVLDQLRVSIIDALRQTGGSGTQKDGMDMSLVVIKSQDSNSKFQIPSSKFQENDEQLNIRTFEQSNQEPSEDLTQASLQRSDMFIEKKSDTNLVATTNDNQSSQVPCDSKTNNKQYYLAQWAGANNPLWVVRCSKNLTGFENLSGLGDEACQVKTPDRCSVGLGEDASANTSTGSVHSDEQQTTNNKLFEFKPDKMPIAIYERMYIFTNHEIELSKGDTIYLMSDGYEDQFGGPKGKKFLSKNLKELIIANCLLTMEEQKQVLEKTMIEWIGVGEQIDDITVLGIKI